MLLVLEQRTSFHLDEDFHRNDALMTTPQREEKAKPTFSISHHQVVLVLGVRKVRTKVAHGSSSLASKSLDKIYA